MDELLSRAWEQLVGRLDGPLFLRFAMQPLMASLLALRAGVADARAHRSAYLWAMVSSTGQRRRLLHDGWQDVRKVFVFAIVLDTVYQVLVFRWVYPVQALLVAVVLAIVPYASLRGPATRVISRMLATLERQRQRRRADMSAVEKQLATLVSRHWPVLLLRGLIAIAFGVSLGLRPAVSVTTLTLLFAAYVLADGLLGIWIAMSGRKHRVDRWVLLLWAFTSIGIGVLMLLVGSATPGTLMLYIAGWTIGSGVFELITAIRLRREVSGEAFLGCGGLISVIFGTFLIVRPADGARLLLWLIATYAVVFGSLVVSLAIEARAFAPRIARS
jgi:uncharacterized membrane protein HdeD (DUF308 family)